ncbi:MAG: amino acid adenylation domain-containing protein [Candidatus Aminicenantes bacterium]|nr:MAG: amino acid adenylation domain-containing protein [Candidatus Aminicenantes bacterium]
MNKETNSRTGLEVAVIGMACRFPGARNCDEFWENLKNSVESIAFFPDQELADTGLDVKVIGNPHYIKVNSVLEDIEFFDAAFFEYTPREAEVMNPQVRIFLECSWHALEDAGYDPGTYDGLIGLYAGTSSSFHWEALSLLTGRSMEVGAFAAENLTNKDHLCTHISYKLGLKGPSCVVQTACSTSLVAIHWACRAVLSAECRMALAGGVTVSGMQKRGYMYAEGMIRSPDGHCRTFDAKAKGTIGGSGAGVVVLKRLKHAITDGDHIYALVKGSAINNDGKRKVGFTAPSVEGQAEVIRTAMAMARVEPESVGYVEAHGTGTTLGDPVEIEALTLAFASPKRGFCPIGSVKSNVGHLDSAAGVSGFIKTVLALKNRLIPPSLHFETPNPRIDFEHSPFYVNTQLKQWKNDTYPLRAGVSSFGIGGTNAHVVLEEWPGASSSSAWTMEQGAWSQGRGGVSPPEKSREYQLILLSAATENGLQRMTHNLATYLKKNPGIPLGDVAYTLQVGRKPLQYRRMTKGLTVEEVVEALSSPDSGNLLTSRARNENHLVFMFPGQGAQYVNMGWELYQREPVFRQEMDRCFEILKPLMGYDSKEILYPHPDCSGGSPGQGHHSDHITQTEIAQPLIFVIEYALAKLLIIWGIEPNAMIGHSIGEYVAACLAGVFSLEDALTIVALRGQVMQAMPPGSMLSVPLPEKQLKTLLASNKQLDLAAVNSSSHCVVSGPCPAVEAFAKILKEKGYESRNLHTSHAFHSKMMDPVLAAFEEKVRKTPLHKPKIPYISNVTGDWIAFDDAVDPGYWAVHLRRPVRFADGLDTLLKEGNCVFVEVGPGRTLSTFARRHKCLDDHEDSHRLLVNLVRHPEENIRDDVYLKDQVSRLWLWGVKIDWNRLYHQEKRQRIPLPLYPFEKQRYWIDGDPFKIWAAGMSSQNKNLKRKEDMSDWFYIPSWKKTALPFLVDLEDLIKEKRNWLVFLDDPGLGTGIVKRLREYGHEGTTVIKGECFSRCGAGEYTINIRQPADYDALIGDLVNKGWKPGTIVHLWGVTTEMENETGIEAFQQFQYTGYYSLIFLTQALAKHQLVHSGTAPPQGAETIRVMVMTNHVQGVTDEEEICPGKTTALGPARTIPLEYQNILCRNIDVALAHSEAGKDTRLVDRLMKELLTNTADQVTCYRGNTRWVQHLEPIRLEHRSGCPLKLKEKGVYLITGGLGKDSLARAKYLAETLKARLILTGRSGFPLRQQWDQWLADHDAYDPVSKKIKQVQEIESLGGEVLVMQADVANENDMSAVMAAIDKQFGSLDGVIHAAGITTVESSILISQLGRSQSEWHFQPKVYGLYTLEKVLEGRNIDFCLLTSSLASFLAGGGLTAYTAANIFMDAFVHMHNQKNPVKWMSLNWIGVSPQETVQAFHRISNLDSIPQLVVFDYDLPRRLEQRRKEMPRHEETGVHHTESSTRYKRSDTMGAYAAPVSAVEKTIVGIWETFFGIEPLGIHDNFFELGGNSLDAITIISKIHMELDVELSLAEFFRNSIIKELAQYVEKYARKRAFTSIKPTEEKEYYLSSSAQKRLYFLQQMYLNSTVYNIFEEIAFNEHGNPKKIEETFKRLIRRHESLRTSFHMIENNPVQKIHKDVTFEVEFYSPGPGPYASTIKNFIRPFDLSQAPLLRVGLIKVEESRHILLIDLHHIVSDRTAHQILQKDFISLYTDEELPCLKLRYKDFTEWQGGEIQRETIKKQEVYWLNEFAGDIPVLNLPTDYPRPSIQSFEGSICSFKIPSTETGMIKSIALKTGATSYMVLLAVLNTLMAKLSGQDDIVIGTTAAGRSHANLENMIGMFVNTLAIRNYPSGEKSFEDFLNEVRQRALSAFANQDYYFEDLVGKVAVNRDASRNPLFDVMFDFHSVRENTGMRERPGEDTDQAVRTREHTKGVAMFDMSWAAMEIGETLSWQVIYCTKLFTWETIKGFVNYFRKILGSVLQNPGIKIAQLEIITPGEKEKILDEFNDTAREYPGQQTIHELFAEQVEKTPDHVAVIGMEHGAWTMEKPLSVLISITYKELNHRSNQLACILKEKGVKSNSLVAIMAERSMETMVGIFAILKAGGAYFPLDPKYPEERIKFMLEDSSVKVLLAVPETQLKVKDGVGERFIEVIDIPNFLLTSGLTSNPASSPSTSQVSPTNLAYVIYTSGSTGRPKGVMIEHCAVVNFLFGLLEFYPPQESDGYLLKTSFLFDVSVVELFGWVPGGSRVVLLPKGGEKDPRLIVDMIAQTRITHVNFVPTMFNALINTLRRLDIDKLSSLRYIFLAGEELLAISVENFKDIAPDIRLENLYGPTECTVYASRYSLLDWNGIGKVPIGKPLPNVTLYILTPNDALQPPGLPGELCISGAGLARGYLNRPQLTAEKFLSASNRSYRSYKSYFSKKIYKTGDLARWLPDGDIEFLGRLDNQVKIRGFRIELGEIENILLKEKNINDAVVLQKGDKLNNMFLCAYIVSNKKLNIPVLKNSISAQLPDYMVPSYFVPLENIPLTPNGKIDKKALPEPEVGGEENYIAPGDKMEKKLCKIWSEILAIEEEKIGTAHNFFKLGGNSLNLIMLVSKIYKEFGAQLSITQIYENPTIMEISKKIRSKKFEESPVVLLNQVKPKKIFCFPPQIAYGVHYMDLAALINDYSWYAFSFIEEEDRLEKYVDIITNLQPNGPYLFFGYSAAGPLTFEVARTLENLGYEMAGIIFLDCFFQEDLVLDEEYYRFHNQAIGKAIDDMGLTFLKDKVIKKSRKYMQYCERRHSLEKIHTNVHLILSEHAQKMHWSGECWEKLTQGKVTTYNGFGHHREVFFPGTIQKQAEIISKILEKINNNKL